MSPFPCTPMLLPTPGFRRNLARRRRHQRRRQSHRRRRPRELQARAEVRQLWPDHPAQLRALGLRGRRRLQHLLRLGRARHPRRRHYRGVPTGRTRAEWYGDFDIPPPPHCLTFSQPYLHHPSRAVRHTLLSDHAYPMLNWCLQFDGMPNSRLQASRPAARSCR